MEAKKEARSCTLKFTFIKGQNAAGKNVYAELTFPHVDPDVSDEDFYVVARALEDLQKSRVHAIVREESASLVAV
ncbi:MAG: DUF1659 domain-containing protein [Selenomonas sp.]|uniref:DUF1659 domain-containing protein n=1 Tax=Selenomonas sp. TaxID=2053611 RepID=UPI0025CEA15E|nr:DUF1659 domain-containing protein [Selenomonas sp.]MCR5438125.1 DUF1659 domain-containing protein [Selenomonas sp.]